MKRLVFLFMMSLFAFSCEKVGVDALYEEEDQSGPAEVAHGEIVLGEKLDDPYSLKNMRTALKSLYPTKAGEVELSATDLYVRFLPKNEAQYEVLHMQGLTLLDHPMDYRIVRDGDYYHDPDLPETSMTWLYAVVPPSFQFPKGIRYEILDECFIPGGNASVKADDWVDWELVEAEAYSITGNGAMLRPETRADASAYPSGRITIVDELVAGDREMGLAGVKVVCNTFVKTSSAYTDDDGYFKMDKQFNSALRYRIVFQNRIGFGIGLNKVLVPASSSSLGKAPSLGLSYVINSDSDKSLFCRAAANNAVCDYFEKCSAPEYKMILPPSNVRLWMFQFLDSSSAVMLQHGAAVDNTKLGQYLGDFKSVVKMFLPDITIGTQTVTDYSDIYALTVHELAHASHFSIVGKEFWDKYISHVMTSFVSSGGVTYGTGAEVNAGYCEVGEMWAYYVQNAMYADRYGETGRLFGMSEWFFPQILLYLDERGLDRGKIQKALQPDVISREMLKMKLVELYPDFEVIIEQAFGRYSK